MSVIIAIIVPVAVLFLSGFWVTGQLRNRTFRIAWPSGWRGSGFLSGFLKRKRPSPKLRKLITSRLPVVVYQALASDVGTTLFAAGAVKEVFGYSAEEWLQDPKSWLRALHEEDRQRVVAELAELRDEDSREITYRIRHRDGSWRWVRDTVTAFHDGDGVRYYLGVMTDISRERELERSQEEARRFFETLLQSGPWMLYRLDGEELRVGYVSPNLESVLGASPEDVQGRKMADFASSIHPNDRRLFARHLSLVRQAGKDHCRIRVHRGSGEYYWLDLNTRRVQEEPEVYFGYALDVHEQIRNEAFLRHYLEQQRELNDLGHYAWEATDPVAFFERAIEVVDRVLQPTFVAILEGVPREGMLRVRAGVRVPEGIGFSLADSQAGYTYQRGEPVVARDLKYEERFVVPRVLREQEVTSTLSVPIPGVSGPYGVLGIGYGKRMRIDETTIRFVQSVARMVGQVVRQRRMLDDLQHMAYYDELTGLPNRRALHRRLSQVLADPAATGLVAFLDLVDFGEVNDTWGHETGDRLLRAAAEKLDSGDGWVARWGGDEFVYVVPGEGALGRLEENLERLARPFSLQGKLTQLRARAGVVYFREHGSNVETLFRRADAALSAAKERNRQIFEYYPGLEREAQERRLLVESLRAALEKGEGLYLEFQPISRLRDGGLRAAEALLRWRHPNGRIIYPADFVPLAERYGLSSALDRKVLEIALQTGISWLRRSGSGAPVLSVNVSPESFSDLRFVGELRALLAYYGFPPDRLTLEITERVLADQERTKPVLAALRDLGVAVVVDDFGTGYSSLAYLANLGIDGLKVDRAFIRDIGRNERTEAVLRAIFALGASLDMSVTAEGVEKKEQYDWLRGENCGLAQGYYVGRPVAGEEFASRFLADR